MRPLSFARQYSMLGLVVVGVLVGFVIGSQVLPKTVTTTSTVTVSPSDCPVTSFSSESPFLIGADPIPPGRWYRNEGGTLWATPWEDWYAGKPAKVLWARSDNGTFAEMLTIEGLRLDGPTLPINATISCCYFSNYQATSVTIPTAGCWEITGKIADKALRFTIQVA